MVDAKAREYFNSAFDALTPGKENYTQVDHYLKYATEEWPDQCDLHRVLEFSRNRQHGGGTGRDVKAAIRNSLESFDALMIARGGQAEGITLHWELPLIPVVLPLNTRGQSRAAYAAELVEQGRYDEARDELASARRERVTSPENAAPTEWVIATVECLLYYRTARWEDLITVSTPLTQVRAPDPSDRWLWVAGVPAVANAFGGAALAHLDSHEAGQNKLNIAIAANLLPVAAWSSLQLGLSYRTAGDEEGAQRAFALGLQHSAMPELLDATRNKNTKLRISAPDVIAARTSFWDPNTEPDMGDFQRQSSQDDRRAVLKAAMDELDLQVGMVDIKERMRIFAAEIKVEGEQRQRGMKVNPKSRHMIFKGPPGTGKTTIARLIAQLYYGLGVISGYTCVQRNRATLIGAVEGESAKRTLAAIKEARGGVLFVDEAYDLVQDRGGQADPFGSEALTTLLEYMENDRAEMVVIIAGYEAPLERFLAENPGFKSRFAYSLSFDTYNPDDMWQILVGMAKQEGRSVDPTVEDRFKEIVELMWVTDQRNYRVLDVAGNGRFARNVFEQAQGLAARRLLIADDLSQLTDAELTQLSAEDILGAVGSILKGFGLSNVTTV